MDMNDELILIVEDNENSRMLARDVLQATGYRTAEADTAEEGLRLARETHPDLILLDIQLPGMSGLDALGHLRGDPATRGIPVMAVTASAMTHDRPRIMAAGFDGYQTKPISVRDFLEAVRSLLARPRAHGAS
jgi:two-component system cell cycle response regulator DivK